VIFGACEEASSGRSAVARPAFARRFDDQVDPPLTLDLELPGTLPEAFVALAQVTVERVGLAIRRYIFASFAFNVHGRTLGAWRVAVIESQRQCHVANPPIYCGLVRMRRPS
jgi:hypothetical protein